MCAFNPCSKAFTHPLPLVCSSSSTTDHFNEKLRTPLQNVLVLAKPAKCCICLSQVSLSEFAPGDFPYLFSLWLNIQETCKLGKHKLHNTVRYKTIIKSLNTRMKWTLSKGISKIYGTMKEMCTCQRELKMESESG
jgi:hypothetical protein